MISQCFLSGQAPVIACVRIQYLWQLFIWNEIK
jgi:hypothetical protein